MALQISRRLNRAKAHESIIALPRKQIDMSWIEKDVACLKQDDSVQRLALSLSSMVSLNYRPLTHQTVARFNQVLDSNKVHYLTQVSNLTNEESLELISIIAPHVFIEGKINPAITDIFIALLHSTMPKTRTELITFTHDITRLAPIPDWGD